MLQDLRYGIRMLLKNPGFTTVAVLTLALGIGANTAMFSLLNTYLFRALPYPNSGQLVRVYRTSPHSQSWPFSTPNFYDQQEQNGVFDFMSAFSYNSTNMAQPGEPAQQLRGLSATAGFFYTLGVQPALGRVFTDEDDQPGSRGVVVLSDRIWMSRFGGDPNVLGRTLRLDGKEAEIIGVMPPDFEHPILWSPVDIWRPFAFTIEQRQNRGNNWLRIVGRMKPGVTIERAEPEMKALAASFAEQGKQNATDSIRLEPLQQAMSDEVERKVMWFTFGLAGFVLLIACANIANLQLARTAARAREFAVRAALGAQRRRLLRQSLTESLIISLIGGGLSLVLAVLSVQFISRQLFSELPGAKVAIDYRVFGFAMLASVLTGLVFGTVPAWLASRADINNALRENVRGSTVGRSHHRLRHALIVGEVAFALVLLTGAGLFLLGLQRFTNQDPGWKVDGLLTAQLSLQGEKYSTPEKRRPFYQQLEERIRALPVVHQVALSTSQLVYGLNSSGGFIIEGQPEQQPGDYPEVYMEPVSTEYFSTLGMRLLEGRTFNSGDTVDKPDVVVINKAMAERFWPGESAVGKRVGRPNQNPRRWQEVVGVIDDVGFPGVVGEPYTRLQSFRPQAQQSWGWVNISMRASGSLPALETALRGAVAEVDPELPVFQFRTVRSLVDRGLGSFSLLGTLLGSFAVLGLVLAAIGIYGVTAYSVAQRTGEIGIRMALGAQQKDVLWLMLKNGAALSLLGAVIGIVGGYAVGRLLQYLIPLLPTRDPAASIVITLALVAVVLVACYLPARRATKVDPMVALRHE